ncbi:MAG: polysaccharide deacetylase family protein [Lachnospiraceae bacterium]|nr:polysaccharide deacetylase family protein [Lachnospiraceae bacterium]
MNEMRIRFPGGRPKCLTLSYDDGVINDVRLMDIFKKHGLKGTFNLNSGLWAKEEFSDYEHTHRRITFENAVKLYKDSGFEVAAHGVTHPFLERIPMNIATKEVLDDRRNLERTFGQIVRGFAYPFGTYTDDVVNMLKCCGVCYARTVNSSHNFDIPTDWLRLKPTLHHGDGKLEELTKQFIEGHPWNDGWLFYVWGHSYEFDFGNNWEIIENFADRVSGRDDVWYATNIEVYDYVEAYRSLIFDMDMTKVRNNTVIPVWFEWNEKMYEVKGGEEIAL